MRPAILPFSIPIFLFFVTAGCGSGSMMMNGTRQLQSLMVTPSAADAQKFPNSQVQFVVTGSFNMAPMSVTSPVVRWSIGNPFATPTPMAMATGQPSINANGQAQCNGFVGIVTIEATAPADPNAMISQMNTMTRNVSGMAQLICP
jgi:hypothetical protein